jgi:prepilin-type N-terminal cleavage/methylation domain-containing protein
VRRRPSIPERGFSLIEAMVGLAILALVMGLMLPTVRAARASAQSAECMSNMRQEYLACATYAADHEGLGPAIGQPYGAWPNWALVVQRTSGMGGDTPGELYAQESVLVCSSADAFYPRDMVRTYAMNGTGHAGDAMGDATDYDSTDPARRAAIHFDRVREPSRFALLVDSAVTNFASNPAPPDRCASVIDFRQIDHVAHRLGRWHREGTAAAFNSVAFDGSVQRFADPPGHWSRPLP